MEPKALLFLMFTLVVVSMASLFVADWAVERLEEDTEARVSASLEAAGLSWATIEADGLIVGLSGTAPSETARFRALEVAARIVDTGRIRDVTTVTADLAENRPDFSVEILRNGNELALIGLVPGKTQRLLILRELAPARDQGQFTDLLESVEFEAPERWPEALEFGLAVAQRLQKSRVIVRPGGVTVEAFFEDARSADATREAIAAEVPASVDFKATFSAPPVIVSPFRFVVRKRGGEIDVRECWSDSETAKGAIYSAFGELGLEADCPEAIGAPTPEWRTAVLSGLAALETLEDADLTITDLDITLTGTADTPLEPFNVAADTLEAALPEIFSFRRETPGHTSAPEPRARIAPLFVAERLTPEEVTMSGPMRSTMAQQATIGFAAAEFADANVTSNFTIAANVPPGWSPRVLAALDALSLLHDGSVEMTMEALSLTGRSVQEDAQTYIIEALQEHIPREQLTLDITHVPELAEVESQSAIDARECERQLAGILREAQIIFDPNSSTISEESSILIDEIAFIITSCPDATFEIGGHTDSQGREEMNLALSQSRADAVMDALLSRDVLLDQIRARGFGESEPIADNSTEEGRARNRRIAFKLVSAGEIPDEQN